MSTGHLTRLLSLTFAICILPIIRVSAEERLPVTQPLISLESREGQTLLEESDRRRDFLKLVINFENQNNLAYCGPATTAMVMNSLGIKRPPSPSHGAFQIFTQENVFNDSARDVKSPEKVAQSGLSLEQLERFLSAQGCKAKATFASETSVSSFRETAKRVLADDDAFLIVNYLRKSLGQESGGHISPVAAYHGPSDRLLILDVSRYKYPPVWVTVDDLWKAMSASSGESGKTRGFAVVTRPTSEPPVKEPQVTTPPAPQ